MNSYFVTIDNATYEEVSMVRADSPLHASLQIVNQIVGYDIYPLNNIIFNSIEELNSTIKTIGIGEIISVVEHLDGGGFRECIQLSSMA